MSLQIAIDRLALRTGNGSKTLVAGLHITILPGTVHTLMGPSGSGKSSVLAAVCGTLDRATFDLQGAITLAGRRIEQLPIAQRRVGLLFQDDLLFAHMTVRENLLFAVPPGARAGRKARREAAALQALHSLELAAFADADPATLSGGQRARVALVRALLAEPEALLLDEPFAKLDAALRERVRTWVFAVVRERQIPALLVTHDPADIADTRHCTGLAMPGGTATPSTPDTPDTPDAADTADRATS